MGTYTTLLLDVDGTLLDFKASERAALETTFQRHGYLLNDSVKETYHAINSALWGRFERGEISREEVIYSRFVELFRALGIDGDGRAFEDEYQEELGRGRFCFRGPRRSAHIAHGSATCILSPTAFPAPSTAASMIPVWTVI